jgi:tetratricopeptide (TPR) repeat protein
MIGSRRDVRQALDLGSRISPAGAERDLANAREGFAAGIRDGASAAVYQAALTAIVQQDEDNAVALLAVSGPEHARVAGFFAGLAEFRSERFSSAADWWRQSDTVDLVRNRAHRLIGMGQPDEALEPLKVLLTIDPAEPRGWLDLGEVEVNLQHWSAASDAYQHVLDLDPGNVDAHYVLARLSFEQNNDSGEALLHLEQMAAAPELTSGQLYAANILKGQIASAAGDIDEAERWLRAALNVPGVSRRPALYELSALNTRIGRLGEARDALLMALQEAPSDVTTVRRLGAVAQAAGDAVQARAWYQQATFLTPQDVGLRVALAQVVSDTSDPADAIAAWQAVLALDPTNPAAQAALRRLANG